MTTWHEASAQLKAGDRIKFVVPHDIFSEDVFVPKNTEATVVENGLNEMQPALLLKPDDENIRKKLEHWDGIIWLYVPEEITTLQWESPCSVEKI